MDDNFDLRYTDRPIIPFGSLSTVKDFYQNSGLQDVISSLPLPQTSSNRGYDPVDMVEGFLVRVILGARRLAHAGLLRHDKVVSEMFGWTKGMASESTFSRFFKKFDVEFNVEVFIVLNRWWFTKLIIKHHTVDIDSNVITRYSNQDGVAAGYNPGKPGRGSHHPLIWELYRHRAEAETQIREPKERYGLDCFCYEGSGATEAAFRWVCAAYNLMSLNKISLINSKHDPTLATLKFQCIALVSYLVRHSRKTTLVMPVNDRRRDFFDGYFQ